MRGKKIRSSLVALLTVGVAAVVLTTGVLATDLSADVQIKELKMTQSMLSLYLDQSSDEGPVSARIGSVILGDKAITNVGREYPVVTWLLVDNSASIASEDRTNVMQMLTNLVAGKAADERFNLCTYDVDVRILVENSNDYTELKTAIDAIEYKDQKAYLLDALYQILDSNRGAEEYVRIVVMGDGIESNPNGLTEDEISKALDNANIPVYVFGCRTENNSQELSEMYSLSRMTGAEYWTLSELNDPLNVVSEMSGKEMPFRVDVSIPEELKDGNTKGVLLTYTDSSSVSVQVTMPFGEIVDLEEPRVETEIGSETDAETEVRVSAEAEPETSPETADRPEEKTQQESNSGTNMFLLPLIGIGVFLVVSVGLVTFFIVRWIRAKNRIIPVQQYSLKDEETEYIRLSKDEEGHTQVLIEGDRKPMLCITDRTNRMRRMETPLRGRVSIGRDPSNQIVLDYDRTVSNRHCEIFVNGNAFIIQDLHSSNGTFVDGKKVVDQAEISSGSILKLGRLELEVEIR